MKSLIFLILSISIAHPMNAIDLKEAINPLHLAEGVEAFSGLASLAGKLVDTVKDLGGGIKKTLGFADTAKGVTKAADTAKGVTKAAITASDAFDLMKAVANADNLKQIVGQNAKAANMAFQRSSELAAQMKEIQQGASPSAVAQLNSLMVGVTGALGNARRVAGDAAKNSEAMNSLVANFKQAIKTMPATPNPDSLKQALAQTEKFSGIQKLAGSNLKEAEQISEQIAEIIEKARLLRSTAAATDQASQASFLVGVVQSTATTLSESLEKIKQSAPRGVDVEGMLNKASQPLELAKKTAEEAKKLSAEAIDIARRAKVMLPPEAAKEVEKATSLALDASSKAKEAQRLSEEAEQARKVINSSIEGHKSMLSKLAVEASEAVLARAKAQALKLLPQGITEEAVKGFVNKAFSAPSEVSWEELDSYLAWTLPKEEITLYKQIFPNDIPPVGELTAEQDKKLYKLIKDLGIKFSQAGYVPRSN